MYAALPGNLQDQIREYLMADRFSEAKDLHDAWLSNHANNQQFEQDSE